MLKLPPGVWQMIVADFPGTAGFSLRYNFWKKRLRNLGVNVKIDTGVYFQNPDYISIDDNCWIDKNTVVLAGPDNSSREKILKKNDGFKGDPGVVRIGKNVHIGIGCVISGISAGVDISDDCCLSAHCKVYAFSHHYRSVKDNTRNDIHFGSMGSHGRQCLVEGPVSLGENTGVALNSVILPGANIGKNCFVAINSVVHAGNHENNSVLAGDPAAKVDSRFKTDE